GGPYRRKITTFQEVVDEVTLQKSTRPHNIELNRTQREHLTADFKQTERLAGREVETGLTEDESDFQWVWDPTHPDANAEGYVAFPNVEVVREMVDLIAASRAYEANITAMNTAKSMNKKALEI
ncbi:flagellar basal body rod protein FlgC, partial [bacterium]|nr:flagellar basal body rod protein FlgC [bacterium]